MIEELSMHTLAVKALLLACYGMLLSLRSVKKYLDMLIYCQLATDVEQLIK